jgi:hypothetical protein
MPILPEQIALCLENLAENDAIQMQQMDSIALALTGDDEIVRTWDELTPKDIPVFKEFLSKYTSVNNASNAQNGVETHYVDDPLLNQEQHTGRYRCAYVRTTIQGGVVRLAQVLRKGYAESINWDEVRLESGMYLLDDPSGALGGEKWLTLAFPNCSPDKAAEMAASLSSSTYDLTSKLPGGATGADWHNIRSSVKVEQDGSCTVLLDVAKPEYSLTAYSDWLTEGQRTITYWWGVPKDLAQAKIDAAKAAGASTAASYSKGEGVVDIVIYVKSGLKVALSKTMNVRCNATIAYYFAWGYTETELGVFLDDHNSDLSAGGLSRIIRIDKRGDGFFDAIVQEVTRTGIELKDGTSLVVGDRKLVLSTVEFGWGVTATQLASAKVGYETQVAGNRKTFEVRRNEEDCTYDYVGTITELSEIDHGSVVDGTLLEAITTAGKDNATAFPAQVAVIDALRVVGNTVQFRGKKTDDGLFNYELRSAHEDEASSGAIQVGAILDEVEYKRVTGASDAPVFQTGQPLDIPIGTTVEMECTRRKNGLYDYEYRKRVESQASTGDIQIGTKGETVLLRRDTGAPTPPVFLAGEPLAMPVGMTVECECTRNKNGTYDYVYRTHAEKKVDTGVFGNDTTQHIGNAYEHVGVQKVTGATTLPEWTDVTEEGKTLEFDAVKKPNQLLDYQMRVTDKTPHYITGIIQGTHERPVTTDLGINIKEVTLTTPFVLKAEVTAGTVRQVQLQMAPDGTMILRKDETPKVTEAHKTDRNWNYGNPLITINTRVVMFSDEPPLQTTGSPTTYVPVAGQSITVSNVQRDEWGQWSWIETTITVTVPDLAGGYVMRNQTILEKNEDVVKSRISGSKLYVWTLRKERQVHLITTRIYQNTRPDLGVTENDDGHSSEVIEFGGDLANLLWAVDETIVTFDAWGNYSFTKQEVAHGIT